LEFWQDDAWSRNLFGRGNDIHSACDDFLAFLVHDQALENDPMRFFVLAPHSRRHGDRVAEADGSRGIEGLVN